MKVLQVTAFFSRAFGGSADVPFQLSRELAARGHSVSVYTSDADQPGEYARALPQVDIHVFKTALHAANFYVTPGIALEARKKISQFDVIHMHNYRTYQNAAIRNHAGKNRVPYIVQAHGSLPLIGGKSALKRVYDRGWGDGLLRDAAKVIAVSAMEAEQYRKAGVPESKIAVVPNGINLADFSALPDKGQFRAKHGIIPGQQMALFVGRIGPLKGLDLLLKAFAGLPASAAVLAVAGPDYGNLAMLKKLAASLGIQERVLFTSPLYGVEKLQAYVDADVFVLPSVYEIFGITAIEALACGTPVIITNGCGIAGLIDGKYGLVTAPDASGLRDALSHILSLGEMRAKFGTMGKEMVAEKFDWSKIVRQVELVYREAM